MPIPTPKPSQPEREFMSACMTDAVMMTEFPEPSQRAAVCHRQWATAHEAVLPPASRAHPADAVAHCLCHLTTPELHILREAAQATKPRRRRFQSPETDRIGERAYQALRRAFRAYFLAQGRSFPVEAVQAILQRTLPRFEMEPAPATEAARAVREAQTNIGGDIGGEDLEKVLRDWQWHGTEDIAASAAETLGQAVSAEQAAFLGRLARQIGIQRGIEARVKTETANWAAQHGSSLVTEVNEATRKTIRTIIGQGLEARENSETIARNLQNFVEDEQFSDYRAKLIARTEQSFAQSKADDDVARETHAQEKEWSASEGDCCEDCLDNASAGVINIDDAFPSGDMTPPAHPNCRCVLLYHGQTPENVERAIAEYLSTPQVDETPSMLPEPERRAPEPSITPEPISPPAPAPMPDISAFIEPSLADVEQAIGSHVSANWVGRSHDYVADILTRRGYTLKRDFSVKSDSQYLTVTGNIPDDSWGTHSGKIRFATHDLGPFNKSGLSPWVTDREFGVAVNQDVVDVLRWIGTRVPL